MDHNNQSLLDFNLEGATSQEGVILSKNQLKKKRKRERWLAIKQERRRHIKENRKHRLAEMREKGEDIGPTRKSLKSNTMKNSSCNIRVVIDLSLDEYMTEKDVNSLTSQLQHSYSANRRSENPMQLYFCSLSGKSKQRLDEIGDYKGWDVHKETRSYEQLFPKESLVYLSSESTNILTSLSEDKVYIIGGLVDHNKHKGLCHKMAEEKGIFHAQLPIAEYLDMKSRKVLAVNHVFSILLRYTETNDWRSAFLAEMPQRKQAHLKGENAAGDACHINTTADVINSELKNDKPSEECSNNFFDSNPDNGIETTDLKLHSCATSKATSHPELLVCNGETEHLENYEQELSIKKELHSQVSCKKENTQNIQYFSDKEVNEEGGAQADDTMV